MTRMKKLRKIVLGLGIGLLGYFLSIGPIAAHIRRSSETEDQFSPWEYYAIPMAFACEVIPGLDAAMTSYGDRCVDYADWYYGGPPQYQYIRGNPRKTLKKITSSHPLVESP